MNAIRATDNDPAESLLSRLAEQAMRTAVEPERSRARARFELMMIAARDPELGVVFTNLTDQFVAISEEAVAQVQQADQPRDPRVDQGAGVRGGDVPRRVPVSVGQRRVGYG